MSAITSEPNRVILEGEWVGEVILDVTWSETPNINEFEAQFEIVGGTHLAGEDYYQGLELMALIRRRSDGKLFGYPYWDSPGNDQHESQYDANGDEHGFESDLNDDFTEWIRGPFWVWLPVETFTITGYRIEAGEFDA